MRPAVMERLPTPDLDCPTCWFVSEMVYTSVSQPGFRRTSSGFPREIVEQTKIFKHREKFQISLEY
jgi:hypothetical protein